MYHLIMLALMPQADATATPTWLQDYNQARQQGQSEQKPVAVILAGGANGYQRIGRDGGIGKEANALLAARYVCVHVDTATEAGRNLARSFGLTGGLGIVISDRSGAYQAFFHEGDLSNVNLVRYLQRYGDPNRVFVATETNPGDHGPACPTCASCPGGRCRR